MTYIFSSERQLIFKVVVAGRDRLVEFGERNNIGRSLFVTENHYIAAAIRRHDFYKNGIITEAETPTKAETPTEGNPTPALPEGEGVKEVKRNVVEVENISAAREYLVQTFGVERKSVKSPSQIKSQAKKCGIEIRF